MTTSVPLSERQRHEAAVYDARALALADQLDDADLGVEAELPPYPNRAHIDFMDALLQRAGDLQGKRVLEVGCGTGALSTFLALRGAEVVGVDVSEPTLALARRRADTNGVAGQTRFEATPIERCDEPDESFDVVVANQVLHHLELGHAMPNIARLIGERGVALFVEPVLLVPEWLRQLRYHRRVLRVFPAKTDTPDERSLDRHDLELITSAFASAQLTPFQLMTRLQNFVEMPDRVFEVLQRIDRTVLHRVPRTTSLARYLLIELRGRSTSTGGPR
jgi:2-polyprenyl-3-methyl-5-hydroxy-6-metoxy-1,4-benzoquinol methylase